MGATILPDAARIPCLSFENHNETSNRCWSNPCWLLMSEKRRQDRKQPAGCPPLSPTSPKLRHSCLEARLAPRSSFEDCIGSRFSSLCNSPGHARDRIPGDRGGRLKKSTAKQIAGCSGFDCCGSKLILLTRRPQLQNLGGTLIEQWAKASAPSPCPTPLRHSSAVCLSLRTEDLGKTLQSVMFCVEMVASTA